ncbi:hypothetical protein FB451DRAFT_1215289 [Mycena latifolia]|nr:hypothetical protein FB451DRAFT_1215289 [Mycena latifolia]
MHPYQSLPRSALFPRWPFHPGGGALAHRVVHPVDQCPRGLFAEADPRLPYQCCPLLHSPVARWATPYRKNFWSGIRVRLKRHIWVIYLPIIYSYVNWSRFQLVVFSVEPGYAFTYGQSLSVMAAVPSLVSVFNLVLKLRLADLALGWRAFVSELLFLLIGNGPLAGSINEKYFHGQLVLPPLESESFSLPFFHPPTPSAPTLPDVVLEPPATPAYGVADSDPTSAPGSDEQPPGRPSQDISDAYVTELTDSTPASSESHADTGQSAVRTSSLDLANPVPAEHIHIPANSTSILGLADDTNAIPGAPATQETIPCSDSPVEMMPSELMGTLPPRSIDGDSEATRVSVPANVPSEPDVGDLGNTGPSEPESSNNASGISRRDTTMRKRTIQLDHPSSVAEENS